MGHLASVPLSQNEMNNEFAGNNVLGERYYNFEAVNRCLATMDADAVRENKRQYTLVYQARRINAIPFFYIFVC